MSGRRTESPQKQRAAKEKAQATRTTAITAERGKPVDLPRVQRAIGVIERAMSRPDLRERTGQFLRGELEGVPMATKKPTKQRANLTDMPMNVRLPPDMVTELNALVPKLGTRSTVLRLAIAEGLKVLRRRFQ